SNPGRRQPTLKEKGRIMGGNKRADGEEEEKKNGKRAFLSLLLFSLFFALVSFSPTALSLSLSLSLSPLSLSLSLSLSFSTFPLLLIIRESSARLDAVFYW